MVVPFQSNMGPDKRANKYTSKLGVPNILTANNEENGVVGVSVYVSICFETVYLQWTIIGQERPR